MRSASTPTPTRALLMLGALLFLVARPSGGVVPRGSGGVHLLEIDGVISPTTARYLERELARATQARAAAVIVQLDTPGGLEVSMRDMSGAILASPTPVLVWVAPAGARAASAGMFLTLASHLAAMAPGTRIGAAGPVALGGAPSDAALDKAAQDAAAFARSLAHLRERNPDWAEQAVLSSVSATAEEAERLGIIEVVAADLPHLLDAAQGRVVETAGGAVTLDVVGADLVPRDMSLVEQIIQAITDPNIAYILLSIGTIGIIAELYNPGGAVPGVVGITCLVLAFVGLGSLPVNAAGVALLLLGVGLFVGDLAVAGLGALSLAGLLAFVLGSMLLYQPFGAPSPTMPRMALSPWVIALVVGLGVAFFLVVARALARVVGRPEATGAPALIGRRALVTHPLDPTGVVVLDGEAWTAHAEDPPHPIGATVEVSEVRGVVLHVRHPQEASWT